MSSPLATSCLLDSAHSGELASHMDAEKEFVPVSLLVSWGLLPDCIDHGLVVAVIHEVDQTLSSSERSCFKLVHKLTV